MESISSLELIDQIKQDLDIEAPPEFLEQNPNADLSKIDWFSLGKEETDPEKKL